ncbi:hypothetical protein AAF712_002936 [Marasmius tenuissimus]|uniref:F-box domain-containing protein n=1 Tax=Marasmius tenuissimus TaxID=585030 RepID=A0ABR3A9K9_9AGAR
MPNQSSSAMSIDNQNIRATSLSRGWSYINTSASILATQHWGKEALIEELWVMERTGAAVPDSELLPQKTMVPESHFTSVLHTNYVPSAKELKELHHIVLEPQERIRKLTEEILRLQAERDELQRFVDSHRALTAPFRRFPADIWGEIFTHCLPTNKLNVAVCTVKEAPLLLTTVCRAWREIALNTPRLWSSIHIFFATPSSSATGIPHTPEQQAGIFQGIKLWLDRSGSRPLTLSVHMAENMPQGQPPILSGEDGIVAEPNPHWELMNLLVGYSHRWKILSLGAGVKPSHQEPLERLTAADVPRLETVHTGDFGLFTSFYNFAGFPPNVTPSHTTSPDPTPLANFMAEVPSLRSLHLLQGSMPTLEIPIGWSQLTELSFQYQPMAPDSMPSPIVVLQRVAQTCRSLNSLTFRTYMSPGLASFIDPVECNTLREFRLILDGQLFDYTNHQGEGTDYAGPFPFLSCVKDIYRSIVTPQLLRLTLQLGSRTWGAPAMDDVLPFDAIIKGSPRLTHLQITGYHILSVEALSRCLQSASSLTTLKLQPETTPGRRRRGMVQRPPDQPILPPIDWVPRLLSSLNELDLCPRLEVFDCGRCRTEDITPLLGFVQAGSRLSRLKYLKADMGGLEEHQISIMTSASLVGTLESLRVAHGILVVMEWKEAEPFLDVRYRYDPYIGLPTVSAWQETDW